MTRIDCHLHLPVGQDLKTLTDQKRALLDALHTNGIDYGILIPDNVPDSNIGNLQQCMALFENGSRIFLMASVNILDRPTSSVDEFDDLLKTEKIVGLKIFPGHDEHFPNDIRLIPFIELCLKYNTPFMIHTGQNSGNPEAARWNDPKYIVELAAGYPELKIVICHYFWPEMEYCYRITQGFGNIHFDTSGLADKEVEDAVGKGRIMEILTKTITDNPHSVLFGTDYGGCDIASHLTLINNLNLPAETREMVLYKNAVGLFGLHLSTLK